MTISTSTNKVRYEGNGVTATFAFNGRIFDESNLVVEIITRATDALVETLTLSTDYTVTINGPESASVTVLAGKIPSSTQDIQIRRSLSQTQTLNLPTGTVFPAVSVENALDKNAAIAQEQQEELNRTIKLPITSSLTDVVLPTAVANEVIGWNAVANQLTTFGFSSFPTDIDIVTSGLADGDLLQYNLGTDQWNNISTASFVKTSGDYSLSGDITFTGTNTFQGVVDVTNINAETAAINLRDVGGNNILSINATDITATKPLAMGANKITGVADPTNAQDVATKKYVDDRNASSANTSLTGTAVDFTSIPSGVKRITLSVEQASQNGAARIVLLLGDSGGFETAGYRGSAVGISDGGAGSGVSFSSNFALTPTAAAVAIVEGAVVLTLVNPSNNTWAISGSTGHSNTDFAISIGGSKALSAELTQLRLTTSTGTNSFDSGSARIFWEF